MVARRNRQGSRAGVHLHAVEAGWVFWCVVRIGVGPHASHTPPGVGYYSALVTIGITLKGKERARNRRDIETAVRRAAVSHSNTLSARARFLKEMEKGLAQLSSRRVFRMALRL